ncbi:hypothetical protein AXG93_2515s1290 [Marchantia polymorpha subsp. ruderalis]|uniref:Uncharacterized protein n=1 Tax=Marchantia polymorpha subsp. ruderalis TaxID=1480154 RepID=A0A176W6F2_MARPO|nr:hypothetical protein AXG93_2515s1290 [Marchantia polymorpha subsp. ruderalis]
MFTLGSSTTETCPLVASAGNAAPCQARSGGRPVANGKEFEDYSGTVAGRLPSSSDGITDAKRIVLLDYRCALVVDPAGDWPTEGRFALSPTPSTANRGIPRMNRARVASRALYKFILPVASVHLAHSHGHVLGIRTG